MAERVESVIRSKIEFLAQHPMAGHRRRSLTSEQVKFFPVYSWLVVYRSDTNPLQVVTILHAHRDIAKILHEL